MRQQKPATRAGFSMWTKEMNPVFPKGHVISGPDGQAYRLTRDVFPADCAVADDFEPLGGAPKPVAGGLVPDWLAAAVQAAQAIK